MAHLQILDSKVKCALTTTHKQFGQAAFEWVLDFENCDDEDIMKLAARTINIDIQRMIRATGSKTGMLQFNGLEHDVKELLAGKRAGKTDLEKAVLGMAKLSPEELEHAIAQLQRVAETDEVA